MAALLIVYIKGDFHNDLITLAIIVFLWFSAGYINTCANILAPAMVPDQLCVRASALMALTFQVIRVHIDDIVTSTWFTPNINGPNSVVEAWVLRPYHRSQPSCKSD